MSAYQRQKKPRGWKRRVRELDRWAARHSALDLDQLRSSFSLRGEIRFERWPAPIPTAVRRRMVQHLVQIHDLWLSELRQLDEPFYLAVWLFEPHLSGSQVVAAVDPAAIDYCRYHDAAASTSPPALYQGHPYDLSRFQWTRRPWVEQELLSSFGPASHPRVLRDARGVERKGGETIVTFKGEDWYGMLPSKPAHQDLS